MIARLAVPLGALVASAVIALDAQDPQRPPVFRAGTETVAIYANVFDRYGEIVRGLTREDFDVWDNGVRQPLTVFVNGIQPITAMLLLDTSQSMTFSLDLAKAAAEQFIIRMLPGDVSRVGSFSDAIVVSRQFTGDRDRLLHHMREGLHIGNPTRLWDAIDMGMTELATIGGRRVLLLLTDGEDTLSRATSFKILDRARSEDVMICAVQFRTTALARLEVPSQVQPRGSGRSRATAPGEVLRELTARTGGGYFFLRQQDDVNATFARLTEELHYQYVLGFSPANADGKVHRLDVRVRNRSQQVTVRARQSYLAPAPARGGGTP